MNRSVEIFTEEPLYTCVNAALRASFRAETWDVCRGSSVFSQDSVGSGISPWDAQTQAVFIRALASRTVDLDERHLMEAIYTLPIGQLVERKELNARSASFRLWQAMTLSRQQIDRWYLHDVLRAYIGLPRSHDEQWWQKHLSKSERQLRRIRRGDGARNKKGAEQILDSWHDSLMKKLEAVFQEKGVIS